MQKGYIMRLMKSRKRKGKTQTSVSDVTDAQIVLVLEYVRGDLRLMDLMQKIGANTTSVYSFIARAIRAAYKNEKLKI